MWRIYVLFGVLLVPCSAQTWSAPQSGWLYVLDEGTPAAGQVLLVDPAEGAVKGALPTGYHPNFGMCGDGSRLFVTDGTQAYGYLSLYDTATGKLLNRSAIPHHITYTGHPRDAGVGCSADGKWAFVQEMVFGPGVERHSLAVVNNQSGRLLPSTAALPVCGLAKFVVSPFPSWDVVAECGNDNSLNFVALDSSGNIRQTQTLPLRLAPQLPPTGGGPRGPVQRVTTSILADAGAIEIFRFGGGIGRLGPGDPGPQPMIADQLQYFLSEGTAISLSSGLTYAGFRPYADGFPYGVMTGISVRRSADLSEVARVQGLAPFSSLAVSPDGAFIYTVSDESRSITQVDGHTLQVTKVINNVGGKPALVIVQP
jgi:DNA-binding beta-propeller fold protein YncE